MGQSIKEVAGVTLCNAQKENNRANSEHSFSNLLFIIF